MDNQARFSSRTVDGYTSSRNVHNATWVWWTWEAWKLNVLGHPLSREEKWKRTSSLQRWAGMFLDAGQWFHFECPLIYCTLTCIWILGQGHRKKKWKILTTTSLKSPWHSLRGTSSFGTTTRLYKQTDMTDVSQEEVVVFESWVLSWQ